jgi:hypothetical protein
MAGDRLLGASLLVVAASTASMLGCRGEESRRTVSASPDVEHPGCPSEAFMEEVHASAFHFQHGSAEAARSHLARARALMPAHGDAVSATILLQLSEISRRIEADPNWARSETEYVRVAFSDWPCLTESLHERFHGKLPPLR